MKLGKDVGIKMKYRKRYRCRFWDAAPIVASAVNEAQANFIALAMAKKHNWKLQGVGLVV